MSRSTQSAMSTSVSTNLSFLRRAHLGKRLVGEVQQLIPPEPFL
jgi:hypothetical protein